MEKIQNDREGFGKKKGLNRSWTNLDGTPKFSVRIVQLVFAAMLVLPVMLALTMPTASAVMGEEYAVQNPNGQVLAIVGFVGLIFMLLVQFGFQLDIIYHPLGAFAVVILAMVLVVPLTLGGIVLFEGEETFCEQYPDDPSCRVIPPPQLTWMIDLDEDGDVDGSTYPAGLFTDVDTAIGGTTGEWQTAVDANMMNDVDHRASVNVVVNTSMNWDNALWMEPNAFFIEAALIKLLDGPKSSAGAIETQQYWGRIDRIDYIQPSASDNETGIKDPLYIDSNYVHHIGWQDESNNWLQACSEYQGMPLPSGASCGPVPLGDDNSAGDAIKAVASGGIRLFWIYSLWADLKGGLREDRGPFSWSAINGASWSLTFSIGSETDWHTYTFVASYTESATADNA